MICLAWLLCVILQSSVHVLNEGLSSGQVLRVKEKDTENDLGPFKYCGTKDFGKDPNYYLKEAH